MIYSAELTGNIIKTEREKRNLSQRALGKLINVSGKQISNYEKGNPMPPIDILMKFCETFDCELGFLLGEESYSDGTKLRTAIIEKTGLSDTSIQNIQRITGTDKRCVCFGHNSIHYRTILNNLLSSEHFISLLENMSFLDERISAPDQYWLELEKKYGKENVDKAFEYYNSSTDYFNDSAAEQLPEIYYKIMGDIEATIDKQHDNEYSIKVARYELNESFSSLIESIYPK